MTQAQSICAAVAMGALRSRSHRELGRRSSHAPGRVTNDAHAAAIAGDGEHVCHPDGPHAELRNAIMRNKRRGIGKDLAWIYGGTGLTKKNDE
jgi:hypothetical protein